MSRRVIIDDQLYAHFITFSCDRRRRLLSLDQPKRIVLGVLNQELKRLNARCIGFVIMPNHVHAIVWFPAINCLSRFLPGAFRPVRKSVRMTGFLWEHSS